MQTVALVYCEQYSRFVLEAQLYCAGGAQSSSASMHFPIQKIAVFDPPQRAGTRRIHARKLLCAVTYLLRNGKPNEA
jgi:hypothetical protein